MFEMSASASFSESSSKTIAYSDTSSDATTNTHTIVVNVNVPVGKTYRYAILVFNGQCSIPYTAHMLFQSSCRAQFRIASCLLESIQASTQYAAKYR